MKYHFAGLQHYEGSKSLVPRLSQGLDPRFCQMHEFWVRLTWIGLMALIYSDIAVFNFLIKDDPERMPFLAFTSFFTHGVSCAQSYLYSQGVTTG